MEESAGQGKKRGPKVDYDRVIVVSSDKNPKKAGTEAHKRFERYKPGMTVKQAIDAGVTLRDIRHDAKMKYIAFKNGN